MPSVKHPQLNDPEWMLDQERVHGGVKPAARANGIPESSWRKHSPTAREKCLAARLRYRQSEKGREKKREAQRRLYYKRKSEGLCVSCGGKPAISETRCDGCLERMVEARLRYRQSEKGREKKREAQRRLYYKRKSEGLCVSCGGKPAISETRCDGCLERMVEARLRYRQSEKGREKKREAQRRLYYKRKSEGLCVSCGGKPAISETRCDGCLERMVEARLRYRQSEKGREKKREAQRRLYYKRKSEGLCVSCGGKPAISETRCDGCLERMVEARL